MNGSLMLISERAEEHVYVLDSKMLKFEARNLKERLMGT